MAEQSYITHPRSILNLLQYHYCVACSHSASYPCLGGTHDAALIDKATLLPVRDHRTVDRDAVLWLGSRSLMIVTRMGVGSRLDLPLI